MIEIPKYVNKFKDRFPQEYNKIRSECLKTAGCGVHGSLSAWVPDRIFFDFGPACLNHDIAYVVAATLLRADDTYGLDSLRMKLEADWCFRENIRSAVDERIELMEWPYSIEWVLKKLGYFFSDVYRLGVMNSFGRQAFYDNIWKE